MEGDRISSARLNLIHLPTWMLVIGFPVYWLELYVIKQERGHTSWLAWSVFLFFVLFTLWNSRKFVINAITEIKKCFQNACKFEKAILLAGFLFSGLILLIGLKASLLPPHLGQEFDALNYHITIPRQHLILQSFQHLKWSAADLFLMPVDYALAPYWLSTGLPNKIPQFIFVLGLLTLIADITGSVKNISSAPIFYSIFAVLGFHVVGIQIGLAMLDLAIAYLFFAAVHSVLKRHYILAGIEFAFYFWSKPLMPIAMFMFFSGVILIVFLLLKFRFTVLERELYFSKGLNGLIPGVTRMGFTFLIISTAIAGPFIYRSIKYAGTPLFPIAPGSIRTTVLNAAGPGYSNALKESSKTFMDVRDLYGSQRTVINFIKHLWIISVPEKDVNNRFDYPTGLVYLLLLGPFVWSIIDNLKKKKVSLIHLGVLVSWGLWWFGSQQSRFLYIPLLLMVIAVLIDGRFVKKTFLACLILALFITAVSVFRAHKRDLFANTQEVLRPYDKELIGMSENADRSRLTEVKLLDAAYADFPIKVIQPSAFVLNY
jgi:hypothetical protein